MINVCKWFVTFGQPYLRASATACRLIKSPISLITLQMPCRIRGCLMRTSLPVMMDLGPFAPKCDQQRAKKSFVVFCRNGTGKKKRKKGKPSGLDFPCRSWLITCNLLPANTWSIILCPHRWTTCYGCYISEPKDSKIASFTRPAWWRPGMENTSVIYF